MKNYAIIKRLLIFSWIISSTVLSMENPKKLPVAIRLQEIMNRTGKDLTMEAHYSSVPLSKKFSADFKNIVLNKDHNHIKKNIPLEYQADSNERHALLIFKDSLPTIALKIVHTLNNNTLRVMVGVYGDSMLKELIKMDTIDISHQKQVNLNAIIDGYKSDFSINFDTDVRETVTVNKKPKKGFSFWKKQ